MNILPLNPKRRIISLPDFAARRAYRMAMTQPTQNEEGVRIGDLFYVSWGWEQTNVDFYEIVALKGKHTVVYREIAKEYVGGFGWTGECRPCRGHYVGEPFTARTTLHYGVPLIRCRELSHHYMSPTTDDALHHYTSYA